MHSKDEIFLIDIMQSEASNQSSFNDLSSKTLILSPSRLFTVTQEFSPKDVRSSRRRRILTSGGNNENLLSSRTYRLGH